MEKVDSQADAAEAPDKSVEESEMHDSGCERSPTSPSPLLKYKPREDTGSGKKVYGRVSRPSIIII